MNRFKRMLFRRSTPESPNPDAIADKVRSIRDGSKSDPPMAPEDVTGVQTLALQQLEDAMREGSEEEQRAAEAMRRCKAGLDETCSVMPGPIEDPA